MSLADLPGSHAIKEVSVAEQPNQFKCHSCGRSFSSEDQLREHEKNCFCPRPHAVSKHDL